ncbi:STAS domain-containing protein [Embleya sp. NBC_00896]|uniref:STAS domain-containing protein n=1 Tax=Embleya sp. NBC_00896 TaxID=2975961 RepID=UPI0038662309|nr:STAS domain-containing protein [Embleya sp. NBC_00896]
MRARGQSSLAVVRGEVDITTVPEIARRLDFLTAVDVPDVVVDLRAVTFIDARGIDVLARARSRAVARGGRLRLVCRGFPLRVLRLPGLGLGPGFEFLPDVPPAFPPATG